jgi:hypothetical protein
MMAERAVNFEQQVATLINKGYPGAAGMTGDRFAECLKPLNDQYVAGDLIVIPEQMVSLLQQISRVMLNGRNSWLDFDPRAIQNITGLRTPSVPYLIKYDWHTHTIMRKPRDSHNTRLINWLKKMLGHFQLTAQEGTALATHYPLIIQNSSLFFGGSRYGMYGVPVIFQDYTYGGLRLQCYYPGSSQTSS